MGHLVKRNVEIYTGPYIDIDAESLLVYLEKYAEVIQDDKSLLLESYQTHDGWVPHCNYVSTISPFQPDTIRCICYYWPRDSIWDDLFHLDCEKVQVYYILGSLDALFII